MTRAAVVVVSVTASAADGEGRPLLAQGARRQYAATAASGSRRGRPRKFGRPARAVTLTLPEDVLTVLRALDPDLSRAIVRATQSLVPGPPGGAAELTSYGNRAVIIVPRSRALRERTDVELVPLSDGRALMCMDERLSIPQLELQLTDALADPALDGENRTLFEELVEILRNARKGDGVELRQRQIIVLHHGNGAGPSLNPNGSTPPSIPT